MSDIFNIQRRLFIKRSLVLSALGLVPLPLRAAAVSGDVLLGGGRFQLADGDTRYAVSMVAPHQKLVRRISTDFFPHGFVFSPERKTLVYSFEKIGPGAGVFDLDKGEQLASIQPVKGRLFYGHGACTVNDQYLFSTETSPDGNGAIGIRDPKTLEYLGDFPTYGLNPHECRLIDDDKVLMVTNGGGTKESDQPGSLCYIDVMSQKLLDRADIPDSRFNAGHLYPLEGHKAVVISAPRLGLDKTHLGAVSVYTGGDYLQPMTQPEMVVNSMSGEALSVEVIPDRDLFVVTHPTAGMLSFWSIRQLKYVGHIMVPNARGVVLAADNKHVWVSCTNQASVRALNLDTLKMDDQIIVESSYITGSHLINLAMI